MADSPNNLPGTGPGKKKELTMEMRLLIAFILMGVVLFLTPYVYKPATPPPQAKPQTPAAKQAQQPPAASPAQPAPETAKAAAAAPAPGQIFGEKEEIVELQTDIYTIRFSNRGAVVRDWIFKNKKYTDSRGQLLNVVNPAAVAKTGYPFGLEFKANKPSADLNQVLYFVRRMPDGLGVEFEFSDGKTHARKTFQFKRDSYLSKFSSSVTMNGAELPHLIVWRGGFGDPTMEVPSAAEHSLHYNLGSGKLEIVEAKKAKDGLVSTSGNFSFAGLEDHYFAAVFLPQSNTSIEAVTYSDMAKVPASGKDDMYVGTAVGGSGQNDFSLFVGPKDIDLLKKIDPKLAQMIDWGWFWFLAEPLFYALNWVHDTLTHNFGWAIILVTVAINMLLLPLRLSSMKSMKKMSQIQPQIAAINEKYKGISMRDPRKNEQNQEIMELYKRNGVNPAGGCVPMLIQLPFFFAFYKVLSVAIELRGAPWLWVTDLSLPETLPIRILPVAMVITQFFQQKMTPSTSPDPTQQRVMLMMPLMLGFFFYGVSSGLVLYWLTGNVIGIAQQWIMNRMSPAPAVEVIPPPRKKGSRK